MWRYSLDPWRQTKTDARLRASRLSCPHMNSWRVPEARILVRVALNYVTKRATICFGGCVQSQIVSFILEHVDDFNNVAERVDISCGVFDHLIYPPVIVSVEVGSGN